VCVSPTSNIACVGGDDNKIHVYSVKTDGSDGTLEEIEVLDGHLRHVHCLQFSLDGSVLASADTKDICVWDSANNFVPIIKKNMWCFHQQRITSMAWSPNGKLLASCGMDDNIFLWNIDKKMKRVNYPFAHQGGCTKIVFLDNDKIMTAGNDGCVCQWNVKKDIMTKFK